ncbi:hypothetical protein [Parapedobacter defluvii]|nr:hypothetical protein [Parapedobacter defluvii]
MRKESHDSSIRMEGQPDGNFRSTYVNNEHYVNIFCLYSVVDDFNFENQKDVWLSAKMQGRYRHFLLIVNPKEFLNRVRAVLDTMYKNTHYDKIKYCDIENRLGRKNCFEKPLKLSYQNEYRIAFQNTRENEEIINIGSIEDISIIMSVEECNRITLHQNQVTLLERLDKIRETHFSDCIKTHLLYEDLLRKAESNPNVENLSLLRDAKDALLAAQKNFYEFCASIRIH